MMVLAIFLNLGVLGSLGAVMKGDPLVLGQLRVYEV